MTVLARLILACCMAGIFSGCLSATPTITPGPLTTSTPTPLPTGTPTPMPLGDPTNPLVMGVIITTNDPIAANAGEQLAAQMAEITKLSIEARSFNDYRALLDAMADRQIHIAWLPPLTYIYASRLGIAQVALLANNFGVYAYGTQFLANADSGFTIYFDPLSGLNSADAATALAQFTGKRPCWVDPGSAAGYIAPYGLLLTNGIEPGEPAFSQSHAAVVRSLYIKGVCDFGATFSISGDPRTASAVLDDLPQAMDRIPIIWRSDAIIPNLNLSYIAGLPENRVKDLNGAILKIAETPDGLALLTLSANNYQVDALKTVEDNLYDPLRDLVRATGINLSDLIGK